MEVQHRGVGGRYRNTSKLADYLGAIKEKKNSG
jgi:hypothetical protein